MQASLDKRAVAEALGTALLVATVVGSGIMGERLSAGNAAIALLANSIATGVVLMAILSTFGPISGAHLNPAVSLVDAMEGGLAWSDAGVYVAAQCVGAIAGAMSAHGMFGYPLLSVSSHVRSGGPQAFSEFIATFGLLTVVWGCSRSRPHIVPIAVGAYITGAYWFTGSTSFANPAVTIGRSLSDTFSGIRPTDVPAFLVAQAAGAVAATLLFRWLAPGLGTKAALKA